MDFLLLKSFAQALEYEDASIVLTSAQESLASHRVVFAAEESRLSGRVVELA